MIKVVNTKMYAYTAYCIYIVNSIGIAVTVVGSTRSKTFEKK
jgi:hypothetical protein